MKNNSNNSTTGVQNVLNTVDNNGKIYKATILTKNISKYEQII